MSGDHAAAAVHADDETIAEPGERRVEKVGRRHRGSTHHDPMHADARYVGETPGAAHPAAVLNRDVDGLDDTLHDVDVAHLAGARRVEVDDVQRLSTISLPAPRKLHRIVAEHRGVVEVAAPKAHGLAVLDVDSRKDDHEVRTSRWTRCTNPASRRRPARELFSGWNCTAQTLSRATAATTDPP